MTHTNFIATVENNMEKTFVTEYLIFDNFTYFIQLKKGQNRQIPYDTSKY